MAEMAEMTEKPINLTGDEVRAAQAGRMTQIRRPVKFPTWIPDRRYDEAIGMMNNSVTGVIFECFANGNAWRRPYSVGDRLWGRETFCSDWCDHPVYRADGPSGRGARNAGYSREPKWRPSTHMPRWAARLFLDVTKVRAERDGDTVVWVYDVERKVPE